jgi:2-C-methyl-D-erythritol 4-phosphate cytidylyltransferase
MVAGGCDPVVVAVPADVLEQAKDVVGPDAILIAGGDTRQDSVRNALAQMNSDVVVVHDGARPFADRDGFTAVLRAIDGYDGAAVSLPVHETLKRVNGAIETVSREGLFKTQTPQAFRTSALRDCHARAMEEGFSATDDLQLLERYGYKVTLVDGSPLNIKVTYPEDIVLAQALAKTRS